MKRTISLLLAAMLVTPAFAAKKKDEAKKENPVILMKTTEGDIYIELWPEVAPNTVANFLGLAEGTKDWYDYKTGKKIKGKPFYDNVAFHRIMNNFMVQGGDPTGTGSGNPGFKFSDEINGKGLGLHRIKAMQKNGQPHAMLMPQIRSAADFQRKIIMPMARKLGIKSQADMDARRDEINAALKKASLLEVYQNMGFIYDEKLRAEKPVRGVIAMANSGPNTQAAQFFLNMVDTPHLTGLHTVFGKVIKGMAVVDTMGHKYGGGIRYKSVAEAPPPPKIISIRRAKRPS